MPDSPAGRELLFSHLSHGPLSLPVAELASGGEAVVRLPEGGHAIPEVVVRPGHARYRRVGGGSLRVPGNTALLFTNEPGKNIESLAELGTALRVRRAMSIEKVSFDVRSCTDSLLLRVNLYQIEGDSAFTPLHAISLYTLVEPSRNEQTYRVDVSEGAIVACPGKIQVSPEQVYDDGDEMLFGMLPYFGEPWHRHFFHSDLERDNVHLGLQVAGREVAE